MRARSTHISLYISLARGEVALSLCIRCSVVVHWLLLGCAFELLGMHSDCAFNHLGISAFTFIIVFAPFLDWYSIIFSSLNCFKTPAIVFLLNCVFLAKAVWVNFHSFLWNPLVHLKSWTNTTICLDSNGGQASASQFGALKNPLMTCITLLLEVFILLLLQANS